jgi:UDP-3-O-[3-hydroxymyristoyl] glucosamine N-acyltransferase
MAGSKIAHDLICGSNLRVGHSSVIEEDVVVGDNVILGHNVVLKSGSRVGSNVIFADYSCTTGACIIGDNINIRTQAVISKSVILEDCVYIGPGVMTNHTKHVTHMRDNIKKEFRLTRIGYGSIIGSRVEILAGVSISPNVIVGGTSLVTKHIDKSGVYFGIPVRFFQDLTDEYFLEGESKPYEFSEDVIKRYLRHLRTG